MPSHHCLILTTILIMLSLSNCSLYFEISGKRNHCFKEFILEDYILIIKWKLFSLKETTTQEQLLHFMKNINFKVYEKTDDDTEEVIFTHTLNSLKDKTSFTAKRNGSVYVCTEVSKEIKNTINDVYINIKLYSDLSEPKISEAIKSQDVTKIDKTIMNLVGIIYPIIERQKETMTMENDSAEETIKNVKWYKGVAFFQILLCVGVGMFQLFNFRQFLKARLVI